ncbi:MAG TPA: carboxy terminal-processing peptidase [Verrucomicrobiae bacterium]|nr:carboxy terminal-processing peptidase [Verrucomicrobiae bacterium]
MRRLSWFTLLLAAGGIPAVLVLHADSSGGKTEANAPQVEVTLSDRLAPGPSDAEIAYVTARLLEQHHFLQQPLDDNLSEKFFERYIETLDPQKLHFTQADLNEFATYRTNLDNLTVGRRRAADTAPAYKIFNRFRERLEQRVNYAYELLKTEKFVFDTEERALINRRDAEPPADLDEAKQLWRQRLRGEYLQEKLAKYAAKKKAERSAAKTNTVTSVGTSNSNEAKANTGTLTTATNNAVAEKPRKTDEEEIVDTLTRRYTRQSHFFRELDSDDVLEYYLTSLAHVYDPHTDYMGRSQAENFAITMNLALFGIGAVLTTDMDGYCKIMDIKPGPAMNSKKLKVGDRIVAVAQSNAPPVDVVEMNLNKVVAMIRGPKGSQVTLTVVSADSTSDRRDVTLIRDEIKLDDQAAKAKIIDLPTENGQTVRVGVIDLPSFYVPMDLGSSRKLLAADGDGGPHYTSGDVARLLTKLKAENCQGIVLDLRRNGGGSLEECVKLTGLFIKGGPIVQVSDGKEQPHIDNDPDNSCLYDGPLVVLTSRLSASASEILAGALQDYGRAVVVGDLSTHGKGTVQQLNPLRYFIEPRGVHTNDPGTLKITKAKFYRASGASTQLKGVMSDIVLPSKFNVMKDIGESALENALRWDEIRPSKYEKLDRVAPFLPELLSRSSDRVSTNQDFAYIREDIEQFRKLQAENSISLNEKERIKEWEEEDARQRARDKERLARKTVEPTVYELTLKQAELPGLPPPVAKTNAPAADIAGGQLEDVEEDAPPAVDATLEETQRILVDYIGLLARKGIASTERATTVTTTP